MTPLRPSLTSVAINLPLLLLLTGCLAFGNSVDRPNYQWTSSAHHPIRNALLSVTSRECNSVLIRMTTTRIPFGLVMPKTYNPEGFCGCDYCSHVVGSGQFSPVETMIFDRVLSNSCNGGHGLVVDVGGNIGYFAMVAASYGCRVVTFEPNDEPRGFMLASIAYNGYGDRVHVVAAAVGGERKTAAMPKSGSKYGWGFAMPLEYSADDTNLKEISMVPLGMVVNGNVLLMKVDTEGFEINVFEGAWEFLRTHDVHNIVMEVKKFNSPEKRALMRNITEIGRLPYVYNYKEHYTLDYATVKNVTQYVWTPSFETYMINVSKEVASMDSTYQFQFEDFWFAREPLVLG